MQQQSDDVMKANSKTAEENMGITCRIPSFWNEFLQQEHIYNESKEKQKKNQYCCPNFTDRLKRFYLSSYDSVMDKDHAKQSEKEQIN